LSGALNLREPLPASAFDAVLRWNSSCQNQELSLVEANLELIEKVHWNVTGQLLRPG
jgi:hypothetical protein